MKNIQKLKIILTPLLLGMILVFQSCNSNSPASDGLLAPQSDSNNVSKKESLEGESEEKSTKTKSSADSAIISNDANQVNVKNLLEAFKGETTASAKYDAYSKKAEAEGLHEIALLFKAASTSENIHANNHKAVLEDGGVSIPTIKPEFSVKSTIENLKDAIAGEGYEVSSMYPEFLKAANLAGNQLATISLNYAYKTEIKHKAYYEKALAALQSNSVKSLPLVYYVCPTCGNTYDVSVPKRCGISMTYSNKFIKVSNI
jgi:rubrerythrin